MNSFDRNFFSRYIPDTQELRGLVHEHVLVVLKIVVLWMFFGAILPAFLYYNSLKIQELVPFLAIELLLWGVFVKIIYEIFNWYNDVWIITNESIIDLDWALFKSDVSSLRFENIEGIEIEQDGIIDKIFNKGTLVIHKVGDDVFAMEEAVIPYEAVDEIEKHIKERLE